MRDRNGGCKKLGRTGREVVKDEVLEDADVPEDQKALQPGGFVFAKPSIVYPDGSKAKQKLKGIPVSGRIGKLDFKRHSALTVDHNGTKRTSWEAKMAAKAKQRQVKLKENALVQARIDEKKEKKQKEEERKARKVAADLKGAVVQAVSTSTVRKMSRKQLRAIRKMDVHSEINPAPIVKTKGLNGKVKV
mmetsp:Transcript_23996/g.48411  ORF Transcript_23996/g.48411 Transcript_23996/m.48411 type:complete len:190 (-) Transcript_23996:165-734(-)